jgi:hypothetical protein
LSISHVEDRVPMLPPRLPPFVPPPQPPWLVGFELASGRIIRATTAAALVLGQADLIRVATTLALLGVSSRVVLVQLTQRGRLGDGRGGRGGCGMKPGSGDRRKGETTAVLPAPDASLVPRRHLQDGPILPAWGGRLR